MKVDTPNGFVVKGMIRKAYDNLIRDVVKQCTKQIGILQVWVIGKTDNLSALFDMQPNLEVFKPTKIVQSIKLTNRTQYLTKKVLLFSTDFLFEY